MDIHLNLRSETVSDAHPREPVCADPEVSTREALQLMKARRAGKLLICADGVLQGIFTERDALKLLAGKADLDVPIRQYMVEKPISLRSGDPVAKAIALMAEGGYRRLPIVDEEGRPSGVLSVTGILHYLVEHFPSAIYTLPPAPNHTMQQREGA